MQLPDKGSTPFTANMFVGLAISGTGIPFGHFVSILEAQLKYPITNETGLRGNFDLSLKYVREDSPGAAEGPSDRG